MATSLPDLTAWQVGALRRYASDFERSYGSGFKRIEAEDEMRAARASMTAQQVAVVDMIAGRGMSVPTLAAKTSRKAADLAALLSSAASRLAGHYEARTDAV